MIHLAGANRSHRILLRAGLTLALGSAMTVVALAGASAADPPASATFAYTGTEQTYVVPVGVTSVQVTAIGAAGDEGTGSGAASGGFGARVVAVVPVSPGQQLYVEVGAGGVLGSRGGYFAGGSASDGGGWGGGASDVRTCGATEVVCADGSPGTLASRLLVAGGGGGGGAAVGGMSGGDGGTAASAGQNTGTPGGDGAAGGGGAGIGFGGTGGQSTTGRWGAFGLFGLGGSGGAGQSGTGGGGGGGGGYFGGGGGGGAGIGGTRPYAGAGGGGGSSYLTPSATGSSAGVSLSATGLVVITPVVTDATPPAITPIVDPSTPDGADGWYRGDVQVSWSVEDPGSGITGRSGCDPVAVTADTGGRSFTCEAESAGGSATATVTVKRDGTPPSVELTGGPTDGASYTDGNVPPAADCVAVDATSGVASCTVTGYGTAAGGHTMVATAIDAAGNTATASATYTVVPSRTMNGFFAPVTDDALNLVKGGSTVPLKFTVYDGPTPVTDTAGLTLSVHQVACPGTTMDTATVAADPAGSTTLRYDTSSGQFIYNWKVPTTPGACYQVTMTTADGASRSALFRLR